MSFFFERELMLGISSWDGESMDSLRWPKPVLYTMGYLRMEGAYSRQAEQEHRAMLEERSNDAPGPWLCHNS